MIQHSEHLKIFYCKTYLQMPLLPCEMDLSPHNEMDLSASFESD